MQNDPPFKPKIGAKALEMIMRDVLDGMEELAALKSYQTGGGIMEVISVTPPAEVRPGREERPEDAIEEPADLAEERGADVVCLHRFRLRRAG